MGTPASPSSRTDLVDADPAFQSSRADLVAADLLAEVRTLARPVPALQGLAVKTTRTSSNSSPAWMAFATR